MSTPTVIDSWDFGLPPDTRTLAALDPSGLPPDTAGPTVDAKVSDFVAQEADALDASARRAIEAEVAGLGVSFDWEGDTYHVSPADEWDIEVVEDFQAGNALGALKKLIGPDQWAMFKSQPDPDNAGARIPRMRRAKEVGALFTRIEKALGTKRG